MTQLIMPGGTDVAEMAFFAVDAMPVDEPPTLEGIEALVVAGHLIRMPTGGDGGYLLHAYVGEEIPNDLMRYCLKDDPLWGNFRSGGGVVAFGGLESAFKSFKPNGFIRADGELPSAHYEYVAYHTEYPDNLMTEEANRAKAALTPNERRLLSVPTLATLLGLLAIVAAAASQRFTFAVCIGVVLYFAVRALTKSARFKDLRSRRSEWERRFPSIVIQLKPVTPSSVDA
jgi:hypothetical protein